MLTLVLLGMLAGIDNVQAAIALSIAPMTRDRRGLLTLSFVLCEGLTPLIGVGLAHLVRLPPGGSLNRFAPLVVIACGIAVLWKAFTDGDGAPIVNSPWTIITLPLSLSLDNLLIGVSVGSLGFPPAVAALTIGGISAAMCATGIAAGSRIGRFIPRYGDVISGISLIAIAASRWIRN